MRANLYKFLDRWPTKRCASLRASDQQYMDQGDDDHLMSYDICNTHHPRERKWRIPWSAKLTSTVGWVRSTTHYH